MSTGVGFAGLGRSLAKRTLGYLKRRKAKAAEQRDVLDHIWHDDRLKKTNTTNYDELVKWQSNKRDHENPSMLIVILAMTLTVICIFLLL